MNIVQFQGENPDIIYEFDKDSTPLGEGGMGCIYQGIRTDNSRKIRSVVAIKCIKPELATNSTVIQRAQREASVQIDHPNLIRMYGFFTGTEYYQYSGTYVPAYYIVMERLVGVNLDEALFKGITTDRSGIQVPIAAEICQMYKDNREYASVAIMQSIIAGVSFLHKSGFIHRDLDPSNIMLTQEGFAKVIDFGICKKIGVSAVFGSGLTQAGQFLGKVAYAAPEMILGDLNSQCPATDVYSLGIFMYQLICGRLPVLGPEQKVMDAHLKGSLDLAAVKNKKLRSIIRKATEKDPKRRYSSVDDLNAALDSLQANANLSATQWGGYSMSAMDQLLTWLIPISCVLGLIVGTIIRLI